MNAQHTITTTAARFLRMPEVLHRIGVSRSTLQRWIKTGDFPPSVALTPTRSTVAWHAAAVEAWITDKLTAGGGISWGTSASDAAQPA